MMTGNYSDGPGASDGANKVDWYYEQFPLHECSEDELTPRLYENGHLHLCMPLEKLSLANNFDYYP